MCYVILEDFVVFMIVKDVLFEGVCIFVFRDLVDDL